MNSVPGYTAPLFMRVEPIKVNPFSFWDAVQLLQSYSHEDAFKVYSVVGGYPGYLLEASKYDTFESFLVKALLGPYATLRTFVNKYLIS